MYTFRIPFAGEVDDCYTPDSVLSHCYFSLLQFFTMLEANTLRLVCREFKACIADFGWEDSSISVQNFDLWKKCFPFAKFCFLVTRKILFNGKEYWARSKKWNFK
jgi:hypothetical protein